MFFEYLAIIAAPPLAPRLDVLLVALIIGGLAVVISAIVLRIESSALRASAVRLPRMPRRTETARADVAMRGLRRARAPSRADGIRT